MKQLKSIKSLIAILICTIMGLQVSGQSGDPSLASGYIHESQEILDSIPYLELSPESIEVILPDEVNNSDYMFFPRKYNNGYIIKYVYDQESNGSCASVSTVFYTLTYELNRVRGNPGLFDENKYPPNFTWNLLNGGSFSGGSDFASVFLILEKNGCPNSIDFGSLSAFDYTLWMHGYEKYHNSHYNKLDYYEQIFPMYDPDNNLLMKHWLAHHNDGSTFGGLIVFGTSGAAPTKFDLTSASGQHENEKAIIEWDGTSNHAMTIVGYSEDIKWDYNNDGQYTYTIDLNNDGQLDVRDWEIGAFNLVGAVDVGQAQDGFVWVTYKAMAEIFDGYEDPVPVPAYVEYVDAYYEPTFEIKAQVDHNERNKLQFKIGKGANASSGPPSLPGTWKYPIFSQKGGSHPMQGIGNDPWMEFSIDFYASFNPSVEFGKIFIKVINHQLATSDATLDYWSIVDRRWGEVFEIQYPLTNIVLSPGYSSILAIPYHLIPHETYITSNLTFDSDMVSRFNPTVSNNATLTIDDGVQIDMYESELEITSTSSLVIDDNVTFIAKDGICKITIDGTISIGSNVSFLADENAQLQLVLNTGLTLSITGGNYDGAAIISYIDDLTISNSDFTDGGIYGFNGDYTISNTDFDNSFVHIYSASGNENKVEITNNCTFSNAVSPITYAVKIDDYPNFTIDDCIFDNNNYGVYVLNSGDGRDGSEITNCEFTDHSYPAIQVYNTDVNIIDNEISDNGYGIKIYNNSNVKLSGSDSPTPTQTIKDNTWYEVYASSGSFPYYFHWNAIIDDDNPQPMVYYSGSTGELDVTNNYWGTSFSYLTDLYPSTLYDWDPIWDPYSKSSSIAESLYESALEKIELEDYSGAKTDLKEIVSDYYSTTYAPAALKKLFAIEQHDESDYTSLKTYLENEPAIQQEEELIKLSAFLINFCEIKLENWQTAINWFENVIQGPDQMEDSIFAIIDLGYTYLWMQNGGYKSTCTGTMIEHIPQSKEKFEDKRDYLLSLLPGDQLSEQMLEDISLLKTGELLQNVPNPFNGTTQIWYKLEEESSITVNVFDYTGKQIRSYSRGTMDKGAHFFEFSSDRLPAGIYFYSLEVNGKVTDSKKMTLMR